MSSTTLKLITEMLKSRSMTIGGIEDLNSNQLICDLEARGIVKLEGNKVKVLNTIGLAIEAIKLGLDIELASKWLHWRDFEKFCAEALLAHGYKVKAPLRFKYNGKKHEVDIVAFKGGHILCLDCKHWKMKGYQGYKIREAAIKHFSKCMKLAEMSGILTELNAGTASIIIPVIVTLMDLGLKSPVNEVLVIPIFKLNSFLLDIEAHLDEVPSIEVLKVKQT